MNQLWTSSDIAAPFFASEQCKSRSLGGLSSPLHERSQTRQNVSNGYSSHRSILTDSHTGCGRRDTKPFHGRMSSLDRKKWAIWPVEKLKNPPALKPCALLMSIRVTGKPPRSDFLRKSPSKKKKKRSKRTPLRWARSRERALCARANLSGVLNRESNLIGRSCTAFISLSVSHAPGLLVCVCVVVGKMNRKCRWGFQNSFGP